jgi:16S rRNA (uracil1498-N3)-methyltransferase
MGEIPLDPAQAHHAREVLRLAEGTDVEVFDNAGSVAAGTLVFSRSKGVSIRVDRIDSTEKIDTIRITVASAVPKGERADWMVEKLSELGVWSFIPLTTERSVVKPQGTNKYERWTRIATESAKQSRRQGVMRIEELIALKPLMERWKQTDGTPVLYLSTAPQAQPILTAMKDAMRSRELLLLVGPEGGWSGAELEALETSGATGVKLTRTVLRVETAAIAGAVAAQLFGTRLNFETID